MCKSTPSSDRLINSFNSCSRSTPDSMGADDLQLRLCEDSGTGSALMISVKRENCEEDEDERHVPRRNNGDESNTTTITASGTNLFQDEDPHRLRIKESVLASDDTIPVVKTENGHSPTTSVSSSDVAGSPGQSDHSSSSSSSIRPWSANPPVRPDIIFSHRRCISDSPAIASSSSPPRPNNAESSPDQTGRPRVPSVILGQSGGVKTMVWTGHWADQQTTPSRPRSVPNGSESAAAAAAVRPLVGGKLGVHRLDNNDPNIRLSVDGLLSLAQSSERRRSSPQVFARPLLPLLT